MVGRSSITHEERLRPRIHAMPIGFHGRGDRSSIARRVVWRSGAADIGLAWSKRGRGPPTGSARPRAREPRRVRQETYVAVIHKPYARASRGGHPPPRRRHESEPPSWERRSATNVECG